MESYQCTVEESLPKDVCNLEIDSFLKEALENPRHRLTVLRMELDIQKFMLNPDQHQFEFQHFPTSYLRLAAHRVAQHYGLQSMSLDCIPDGFGSRVIAMKLPESRWPDICLSDIPMKLPENDRSDHVKIAIRPKTNKVSPNEPADLGINRSPSLTVEKRKEEYDRARARIFNSSSSNADLELVSSSGNEIENYRNAIEELGKIGIRDCNCRVAIFRDREKDRSDPDYDRSYDRYFRGLTSNQNNFEQFHMQNFHHPFNQYETGFTQLGQLPGIQNSMNYQFPPFCALGPNQTSRNAVYMHWPSPAMMYAHSYGHFRQAVIQGPFFQQTLSIDYGQHY